MNGSGREDYFDGTVLIPLHVALVAIVLIAIAAVAAGSLPSWFWLALGTVAVPPAALAAVFAVGSSESAHADLWELFRRKLRR